MDSLKQFTEWRNKRERDPSATRKHKKFITEDKLNRSVNEKENKNNQNQLIDKQNDQTKQQITDNCINILNNLTGETNDPIEMDIVLQNLQQQHLQTNQTLKQKLVNLNNSKYVIEEDEENEELVNLDNLEVNSDYEYNGEDPEEDDENYIFNDYPDEDQDESIDYYKDTYEDDYEREMLEKFEKWNNNSDTENDDNDY